MREVTEIAKHQIQEPLQTVSGVGSVFLSGGRNRAINIVVNTDRLAAYGLSVEDVRQALLTQNLEVPGGIVQGSRELVLRTLGRIQTEREFNDLIVANRKGYPIRVRDIGRAEDSIEEPRARRGWTGKCRQPGGPEAVGRQHGQGVEDVKARLAKLGRCRRTSHRDHRDQSRFIKKSIEEVKFHLLLAAVLVSATILLFIRDWRTTLIATLAIPTSIIPTFHVHEVHGLHAQQHHDARPDPGDRHRDRRRGGRAREHLPPHGRGRHGRHGGARRETPERSPWRCWRPAYRWW